MRFTSFPLALGLLLTGCVAFIATAVGEHRSLDLSIARGEARAQALQTQLQIRKVGALLVDIETGQRGFIITGQVAFLDPYERARQELARAYAELKQQLQQGDPGGASLARLDDFIAQRTAQVERNIERRWQQGEAVLKDLSAYVSGKQLMDDIRHELALLEARQARQIEQATQETAAVQRRTSRLSLVLPAVGLLLIGGALLALLLERRRRDRAEQALLAAKAQLEQAVAERTEALSAALERIQSFALEQDRGIEAERRRLAREVHDQVGQIGTASKMLVLALRKKLAPQKEEMLDELQQLAEETIAVARQISAALRPPLLDDLGLAAALAHHAKGLERQGQLKVALDVRDEERLSAEQRNQLFRILQEAATNVLRHARASRLEIHGAAGAGGYCMVITDDGIGPGSVRPDASGLRNMRERAALGGGSLDFGPGPQGGTRVAVCLPLTTDKTSEEAWT